MTWNWQKQDWPHYRYDKSLLEKQEAVFLHAAGIFVGIVKHLEPSASEKLRIELIANEALQTSLIEGETLDRESVHSSLRRQFGLQTEPRLIPPAEQGIAELMVDLFRHFNQPLIHETLYRWHLCLMKGRSDIHDLGRYRTHESPMQVVSGRVDKPTVHFEAPPSASVQKMMTEFIEWFNRTAPGTTTSLTPLTRAAIAHLYFVTIHPFEDGNGRLGRALAEMALAQGLGHPTLLSMADAMKRRQKAYYQALEATNKDIEITPWLRWFAETAIEAQRLTQIRFEFLLEKTKALDRLRGQLNPRQEKVLLRMYQEGPEGFKGGMSAEKYIRIAETSRATATRDLQNLVGLGALIRIGTLKATRYYLPHERETADRQA